VKRYILQLVEITLITREYASKSKHQNCSLRTLRSSRLGSWAYFESCTVHY